MENRGRPPQQRGWSGGGRGRGRGERGDRGRGHRGSVEQQYESMGTAAYPNQRPMRGAAYPHVRPMGVAVYPNQSPMSPAAYANVRPMGAAAYPNQRPMGTGAYPNERPMSAGGYQNERPMSPAAYANVRPMGAAAYPNQRPMGIGAYQYERPMGTGAYPNERPMRAGGYPNERSMSPAAYANERPMGALAYPNQRPMGTGAYQYERPMSPAAYANERPMGAAAYPNQRPMGTGAYQYERPMSAAVSSNFSNAPYHCYTPRETYSDQNNRGRGGAREIGWPGRRDNRKPQRRESEEYHTVQQNNIFQGYNENITSNLGQHSQFIRRSTTSLNSDTQNESVKPKRHRNRKKKTDRSVEMNSGVRNTRPCNQDLKFKRSGMQLQNPDLRNSSSSIYSSSSAHDTGNSSSLNEDGSQLFPEELDLISTVGQKYNTPKTGKNKNDGLNSFNSSECSEQKSNEKQNKSESSGSYDNSKVHVTLDQLEALMLLDPENIVQLLSEDSCCSNILIDSSDTHMYLMILKVLRKVCIAELNRAKAEVLRQVSIPDFLDNIYTFVSEFPYVEDDVLQQDVNSFYENVIILYETLQDFMPSATSMWCNHLHEVAKSIKMVQKNRNIQLDPKLIETVNTLLLDFGNSIESPKELSNVKGESVKKSTYFPEPVGDFRTVPLFPRPEDIFAEQPFLLPNVIKGPYGSVEYYLDIHFKLLREDFMSPIRNAIRDYKKQQNSKERFKRIENVRIYRKVKFLHPKTVFDKVGYEVCFDVDKKINRVNWEFSNRFMFGSLLLFTNDHFDTFFLATVANRNVKELENKRVIVELQGTSMNANSLLGKEFIMAESEAYFDPYFNVLKALQRFNESNFPLAKYIVEVDTETRPPMYLSDQDIYNIRMANNNFNFRVLHDFEWPSNEDLGLNPSQYKAYKAALTNDMVVIQGPPGTGKTFLGLQIAKSLLQNAHIWNKTNTPILVVCFKNHALDQFLEGLLPVTSKLVRIGGKTKASELDKFNIRERRKEYRYYNKTQNREIRDLTLKMNTVFAEIKTHQANLQVLEDMEGVLSVETLNLAMTDIQRGYFRDDDHLMDWLLAGVGNANKAKEVKVTITSDRGVVYDEVKVNPLVADAEDQRVKNAFFDAIELDPAVPPSDHTVKVKFACNLATVETKIDEILTELNSRRNHSRNRYMSLKYTSDNLILILRHLRNELKFKKMPRSPHEKQNLLDRRDLNVLQPDDRWRLYHIWVDNIRSGLMVELGAREADFKGYAFLYEQLRQSDDIQILKTAHVVGTTTSVAAKLQPMFTALGPKIVIVEEAAEVLEAHIIASLTQSCEQLILIGDHKQLRPNIAEMRLARQYHLDVSLFERMVRNGLACHTLTVQHRMRPEISKQLVPTIYKTLENHESVQSREPIKGMNKNVFFMTHNNYEDEVIEITSKRNQFEADILLRLAKYLVQQGYQPAEITILATYKGQMYHMKNEIKKINDFPKGIQITVVDNFQGEENRIILLSLVRSNKMNKIGFLEIENRVCVALSRARDGLYVIGNMDNLVNSSDIWVHIRNSFLKQKAFGSALELRCEVHQDQVTKIGCVQDFSKVSEGGCSQLCGQPLRCGHLCKSMCHVAQDYHQRYKCREPCPKILCQDGHQCPKKCHQECTECVVPMRRALTCGHFASVPCFMDIRHFKCVEPVEVVIALCGHSVTLPCHSQTNPVCTLMCDVRLDCGHSCDRTCHLDDDPHHVDYPCVKPCARLNKNCSADHKCTMICMEECVPCPVRVQRKLPCGHTVKVICSTDLQSIQCKHKCEKTLACGHGCGKKCWEPCEPCMVTVEKTVPGCGHTVKVACSQRPTREVCEGACSIILSCKHQCAKRCKEICRVDDCERPKKFKIISTLLCGHILVEIPCNKSARIYDMSKEELMQYCIEPCGQDLPCGHRCSGSCSDCMQGRIHTLCSQPCGNVLICGHSCPVPCREVCPPCDQPCNHRCKHSKCVKKCGEVCVPCKEPCDYACPHLKCNRLCGEPCDREPCYEACPRTLACTHPCVGFCGEPCPPCRQCEPHHFEEFFGTGEETEDDAKWVYLQDCKHTLESTGLEYWLNMEQEGKEIVSKTCPRCKSPIITVQRFMNLIKQTYKDVQTVKSQCYGKLEEIRRERNICIGRLQKIEFVKMAFPPNEPDELEVLYEKLNRELPEVRKKKRNMMGSKKAQLLCFFTEFFILLYKRKQEVWDNLNENSKTILTNKINHLTRLLMKRQHKICQQEMESFELEVRRILRMCDMLIDLSSGQYHMSSSNSDVKATRTMAESIIYSLAIYDDQLDKRMKDILLKLKQQIKSSTELTSEERKMISEAMKSSFRSYKKIGHWFKCKNGHIYCITECGGAMVEAVCPVPKCGARIGGQNHTLRSDQSLAAEMDGATYAAWSDQNNMANYGLEL